MEYFNYFPSAAKLLYNSVVLSETSQVCIVNCRKNALRSKDKQMRKPILIAAERPNYPIYVALA